MSEQTKQSEAGEIAVVTGGSRSIGRNTVNPKPLLHLEGAAVLIVSLVAYGPKTGARGEIGKYQSFRGLAWNCGISYVLLVKPWFTWTTSDQNKSWHSTLRRANSKSNCH